MKWRVSKLPLIVWQTDVSGGKNTCLCSLLTSASSPIEIKGILFHTHIYNAVRFFEDKGKCRGGRRHLFVNSVGSRLYFRKCIKMFTVVLLITQQVFTGKVCKTFMNFSGTHDSHWHTLYANKNMIIPHNGWCFTTVCNIQSLPFHLSTVGMEVDQKYNNNIYTLYFTLFYSLFYFNSYLYFIF